MLTRKTLMAPSGLLVALAVTVLLGWAGLGAGAMALLMNGRDPVVIAASTHTAAGASTGSRTPQAATPLAPTPSPSLPPSGLTVNAPAPWHAALLTVRGQPAHLVRGARATVVIAMASWCLYCGYEDKWVVPVIAHLPGVAVNVVDVSPQGGIADPGPANPPFHGHDGTGSPLTVAGMVPVMQHYARVYGFTPAVHVFVATQATQAAWNIQSYPTIALINDAGEVQQVYNGGLLAPALTADIRQVEGGSPT